MQYRISNKILRRRTNGYNKKPTRKKQKHLSRIFAQFKTNKQTKLSFSSFAQNCSDTAREETQALINDQQNGKIFQANPF